MTRAHDRQNTLPSRGRSSTHDDAPRRRAATATIQAACRGHATRSALRDLLGACDELRHDGFHDLTWDDFDGYHEAMLGHDFEDECAGELGARSDDGDGDLSYLSSDDAACLTDPALA